MKTILIFLIFLTGLSACRSSGPESLARNQKRLVLAYTDLLFVQRNLSPADPAYADTCRIILKSRGITESEYSEVLQTFDRDPEKWEAFYRAVLDEIERRSQPPSDRGGTQSAPDR